MTAQSSDGTPPPRVWRLDGWHWLAILAPAGLILGGGLLWVALIRGAGTALAAVALLVVMAAVASPVWGAGLLRSKEERRTRAEASGKTLGRS